MAELVYTANISVDGYTEDPDGRLDWSAPDEAVFAFVTDLEPPAGRTCTGAGWTRPWSNWTSTSRTSTASSTGPHLTRRCTRSSTSSSGRSGRTCTAAACTRRWY